MYSVKISRASAYGAQTLTLLRHALASGLTGAQKNVLVALIHRRNKRGVCWPSLDTIAEDASHVRSTVCEALLVLEALGWILRTRRFRATGQPTSTLYHVQLPEDAGEILARREAKRCARRVERAKRRQFKRALWGRGALSGGRTRTPQGSCTSVPAGRSHTSVAGREPWGVWVARKVAEAAASGALEDPSRLEELEAVWRREWEGV